MHMLDKRFISTLLAAVLALSALSSGASAAEGARKLGPKTPTTSANDGENGKSSGNGAASKKKAATKKKTAEKKDAADSMSITEYMLDIEERYYITLVLPENLIPEMRPYLKNIDAAFSRIGQPLVRRVSQFYEQKNGVRMRLDFQYFTRNMVMGAFKYASSTMYIFVPYPGVEMPKVEGGYAAVHTVLHEFGHAFYTFAIGEQNYDTAKESWSVFNNGIAYTRVAYTNDNPDTSVFPSAYAASAYSEDFAEIFAGMLGSTGSVAKDMRAVIAESKGITGIERKCRFMEQIISQYPDVNGTAMANLASVYG